MKSTFNVLLCLLMMFDVFGETDGVKFVSVMEGGSVTLNPYRTQLQGITEILWTFGSQESDIVKSYKHYVIYSFNTIYEFRYKLNQNGSLTIDNLRTRHSGLYTVRIHHRNGTLNKRFSLHVNESSSVIIAGEAEIKSIYVKRGNSLTLETGLDPYSFPYGYELVLWGFGDQGVLIAKCDTEAKITSFYDAVDGKFRDRLYLHQNGKLTIRNTRTTDSGLYQMKIIGMSGNTSYKKFSVTVGGEQLKNNLEQINRVKPTSNPGLSYTDITVMIVAVILVPIAAAVIYHNCQVLNQERQKCQTVSVMVGRNVTLVTDLFIKSGEWVQWSFEGTSLATGRNGDINETSYGGDETFRERLELDHQTANLIIKNTKPSDTGVYQLNITTSSGKVICWEYSVTVILAGDQYVDDSSTVVMSLRSAEDPGGVNEPDGAR